VHGNRPSVTREFCEVGQACDQALNTTQSCRQPDSAAREYEDLLSAGADDPVKVTDPTGGMGGMDF
jgi:hypothetical protein